MGAVCSGGSNNAVLEGNAEAKAEAASLGTEAAVIAPTGQSEVMGLAAAPTALDVKIAATASALHDDVLELGKEAKKPRDMEVVLALLRGTSVGAALKKTQCRVFTSSTFTDTREGDLFIAVTPCSSFVTFYCVLCQVLPVVRGRGRG
jgi:hypothetical protein